MKITAILWRETGFMLRDRSLVLWMALAFSLSIFAAWSGLETVHSQQMTIDRLIEADSNDRSAMQLKQEDWGGAAYHSFYLTYDPPSDFAFAAIGQRDQAPWKHRVRMLALEGQIYESDVTNPEFALAGRFDFAFLVAFVFPLILIVVLHDLRSGERSAGRYELLAATAGRAASFWALRASLRAFSVLLCLILPLLVGGLVIGTDGGRLALASAIILAYAVFWTAVCLGFASWRQPSSVILSVLIGVWIMLAVIVPSGGRLIIDGLVAVPSGSDIMMTQREAVNDGWDLPKETTMRAFLDRHPEWSAHAHIESPFEWKWYYAFQQVGDQATQGLSSAYRAGRLQRDQMAARLSLLAPPSLVERSLQVLAGTDARSMLEYEDSVRAFHAELRTYFYPKLFRDEPFERGALEYAPVFRPADYSG